MADEVKKNEKEKTLLWMSYGDVAKILGAFLVGIIATIFTGWWNAKAPYLKLTVADTGIFQGDKSKFALISFTIVNDGNEMAKDVHAYIKIKDAIVQEIKVSPDHIKPIITDNNTHINVPRLNRNEHIQVAALANNPDKIPLQPEIVVSGENVVGTKEEAAKYGFFGHWTWWGSVILVFSIMIYIDYRYDQELTFVRRREYRHLLELEKTLGIGPFAPKNEEKVIGATVTS